MAITNRGDVAYDQRRLAEAELHYLDALKIFEEHVPRSTDVAYTLSALARVAYQRHNYRTAEQYALRALKIYERFNPKGDPAADALLQLGDLALRQGALQTAEERYRRSLTIVEAIGKHGNAQAVRYRALGHLSQQRGDYRGAREHYLRALDIHEKSAPNGLSVAETLTSIAALWPHAGREEEAKAQLRRAATIARRLAPGTMYEALPQYQLGFIARTEGALKQAAEHFEVAVEALEAQRDLIGGANDVAAGFAAQYERLYKAAIETYAKLGQTGRAFAVAERYRARNLLSVLRRGHSVAGQPTLPAALREEQIQLNREYGLAYRDFRDLREGRKADNEASVLQRLQQLRTRRRQIAQKIRAHSPRAAALEKLPPLDVDGAVDGLDSDTMVLSCVVLEARTLVFVRRGGETTVRIIEAPIRRDELAKEVERFRVLVRLPNAGAVSFRAFQEVSHRLYRLLLEPALAEVSGVSRLLVLPDGPLHYLPFAALVTQVADSSRPRYLVEDYAIRSAASLAVLAELKSEDVSYEGRVGLVAFGNPIDRAESAPPRRLASVRGASLARLPYSKLEVEAISRLFPDSSEIHVDEDATEARLKATANRARFVHIASHGVLDAGSPSDSYLLLAMNERASADNGLLQVWEILSQLSLNAELVTLSACDTALGQQAGGEGLMSLTRAFQFAGARAVMASLWPILDPSTAVLMTRFYEGLKSGHGKDSALRTAQLEFIRSAITVPVDERQQSVWADGVQLVRGRPNTRCLSPILLGGVSTLWRIGRRTEPLTTRARRCVLIRDYRGGWRRGARVGLRHENGR